MFFLKIPVDKQIPPKPFSSGNYARHNHVWVGKNCEDFACRRSMLLCTEKNKFIHADTYKNFCS